MRIALIPCALFLLFACNDGSSGSNPPTAVAEAGQSVALPNTVVVLDGSGSTDPDGDLRAFVWTQTSGPAVVIEEPLAAETTFMAPVVEESATLEFQLTVVDRWGRTGQSQVTVDVQPNAVPSVIASATELRLSPGETFSLTVSTTDTDGDAVTLSLLNPPPQATFAPALGADGTASVTLGWRAGDTVGSRAHLVFEARDDRVPEQSTQVVVTLQVYDDDVSGGVQVADVTGDGVLDVVAAASGAGRNGVAERGALYVWAGATSPSGGPDHVLLVPDAVEGDRLASGSRLFLEDVTGDGVRDIVAAAPDADVAGVVDAGALYVWVGGGDWSDGPNATLARASATAGDQLGSGAGNQIVFGDVDGDGTDDIVVGGPNVDGGAVDSGGVFVWRGGATLSATPDDLLAPAAVTASDFLPQIVTGQALFLVDLTGDGVLDILAGGDRIDVGADVDLGALYLWEGGSTLSATPDETLGISAANGGDRLGANNGLGIHLIDVTDDGQKDLLVASSDADIGGTTNVGALAIWEGGPSLASAPDAILSRGAAGEAQDCLCFDRGNFGTPLAVGDVDGDGTTDLVLGAPLARAQDEGAAYIWLGPDFTDGIDALLEVVGSADDFVGEVVRLGDVDGDDVLDVIVQASEADGEADQDGYLLVYLGGAALDAGGGPAVLDHGLEIDTGRDDDQLGGTSLRVEDITGDGIADVVAASAATDLLNRADTGAIRVWVGGGAFGQPDATLAPESPRVGDEFGLYDGPALWLGDLDGDGERERVTAAARARVNGVDDVGAVYVWAADDALDEAATWVLTPPVIASGTRLGEADRVAVQLVDVDGDGQLDLVASAENARADGIAQVGAIYVWFGGEAFGTGDPLVLQRADPTAGDELGEGDDGLGTIAADVTGDGIVDVLGVAPAADAGGVTDAGCLVLWPGGSTDATTATLFVPSAHASDRLGETSD